MLKYWFKVEDLKNNYIYSLDMLRLNFELLTKDKDYYDNFISFIEHFSYLEGVKINKYISKSGLNYHYLYNIIIEEDFQKCSFVFGTGLLCKKENEHKGFIEFNPNKCFGFKYFDYFFENLKKLCFCFNLKRYDLAVDIPINRNLIKMVSSSKCNYQSFISYSWSGSIVNSSRTEYQGIRNHNKFCKLYDKSKESKLDYDLTRIEFTFNADEVEYKNLPKFLCIYKKSSSNKIFDVLIQLLADSDDINLYLKNLDYRSRKKIKDCFNPFYINLDFSIFNDIREKALSFNF